MAFDPNNPFAGYKLGSNLSPEQMSFLRNFRQGNMWNAGIGEGGNATPIESSLYNYQSPDGPIAFGISGGGQGVNGTLPFGLTVHRNLGAAEKLDGEPIYSYDDTGRMVKAGVGRNMNKGGINGFMAGDYGFMVPLAAPFAVAGLQAAGLMGGLNPVLAAEGAGAIGGSAGAGALAGGAAGDTLGMTTAEAAGVGSSVIPEGVAFTPATAAEMGAMTGAGVGGAMSGFNWSSLLDPKVIGPVAQLAGGALGAKAAGDASDAQLQAVREAQALNEPFRQGGVAGMNRLLDLLGLSKNTGAAGYGSLMKDFSAADFQADPGYAFRQAEGERGLTRAASASGLLGSGKYLRDATRFNQDLASQEYGNAFNRFQTNRANKLNPLQSLMGAGQTAAGTVGDFATQAGDARAAGSVGRANAWTDAIGQGVSMYQRSRESDQNKLYQNAMMDFWKRGA